MQFSEDLVSFPSLPGRLMCSDDPCIFFFGLLLQEERKNRVLLDNLFGLAFGGWSRLGT